MEGDGGRLVLEERLRELCVPDKFVGVHRRFGETAARVHADVRGERHAPVEGEVGVGAIGEIPRIHVGILLQRGARVLIVNTALQTYVVPTRAVGQVEALAHARGAGGAARRIGRGEDVVVVLVGRQIHRTDRR